MKANANTIKIAEQVVASHKRRLISAGPNRDQVKRQIQAAEDRLAHLREAQD